MIVKYSKKFPYAPYLNEDIGYEKSIPDNATEEEIIQTGIDLNRIATATFNKLNPGASPTPSITDYNTGEQGIEVEKVEIGDLPAHIKSCNDKKALESYKLLVRGKPELEELYFEKLEELS